MKAENIRKDTGLKKKNVHRTENFNRFASFTTHFQKNGERISINKICFRFSGIHRLNISRIWFPFKSFIFNHAWWPNSKHAQYLSLSEKCPNTEFFLVHIFPHSDWIRRFHSEWNTDQKKNSVFGHFSRSV